MTKADKMFREVTLYNDAMNRLNELLEECANDMFSVGIPVQKDKILNIGLATIPNTHAVCCFKKIDGITHFIIAIKKNMMYHLNDKVVMANVKNSIYHELIHTCPRCTSHNKTFLKWAHICDMTLGTQTLVYLEDVFYYNKTTNNGVVYVCPECGNTYVSNGVFAEDISCEICKHTMQKQQEPT